MADSSYRTSISYQFNVEGGDDLLWPRLHASVYQFREYRACHEETHDLYQDNGEVEGTLKQYSFHTYRQGQSQNIGSMGLKL